MKTYSKYNKSSKLKAIALVLAIILLFTVAIVFIIFENNQTKKSIQQQDSTKTDYNQPSTIDNNPPTPEQKAAGDLQKEATKNPVNNDLGISITSKNITSDIIQIKSVIDGAISNSGICTLQLTKSGITISKIAETYAMPTSSTCRGFDINRKELSNGEWQIKLTVSINNKESSINDSIQLE